MDEIEINKQTGAANFFAVKEPAWHGLGVILNEPPTVKEGIVLAGLDWKVRLQPLHTKYDGEDMPIPGWHSTIRDTDRKVLGVVGPTFKPLQNIDAFEFFQPWIDEGLATLETAGSLRGGKRVWVMAKLKGLEADVVSGDPILGYVLLSNGHDGTMAIRAGLTAQRVVCANTLAMAHGDTTSKLFRIRHTKKAPAALSVIRETMNKVTQEFEATIDQYKALARCGVVKTDIEKFVRRVFKPQVIEGGVEATGSEAEAVERLTPKIIRLFEEGAGNTMPGVNGTAWAMYNAVTDFTSHERGNSADNRVNSLWYGDSAKINQRALQVALQMTG